MLGNLYAQALEAKGYKVNLKENIGATEIIDKALTSRRSTATRSTPACRSPSSLKNDSSPRARSRPRQLVKEFYEGRGQAVSDPTPFQDTDAIATTKEFAEKNNLNVGGRPQGHPAASRSARGPSSRTASTASRAWRRSTAIKDNVKFKQLALGLQYPSLDKGDVDTANVFSTDAQLASGKYTVLEDPKGVFGFQNVYFVINKDKLRRARRRRTSWTSSTRSTSC